MNIPNSLRRRITGGLVALAAVVSTSLHAAPVLSSAQLDELLGPIALYPDALVAILLPASTVPADIVLGARYIDAGGDVAAVDGQPWDDSVKSLARYPDVLTWMNENLEWTTAVGEAFLTQPDDVMRSIQGLRLAAKEAGNLKTTKEQVVVVEKEVIRIVPAEPEIIYVPQYDPGVVFVQSYNPAPLITFGVGFAIGSWLSWDCDWRSRWIYRGNWCGWNNNWWNDCDWQSGNAVYAPQNVINNTINNNNTVNVTNIVPQTAQRWQPGERNQRQFQNRIANQTGNARFANTVGRELRNPGPAIADNRGNGRTLGNRPAALPRPSGLRLTTGAGSNGRNNPSTASTNPSRRPPETARQAAAQSGASGPARRAEIARAEVVRPGSVPRQSGFVPTRPPRVEIPSNATTQAPQRPAQTTRPGSPAAQANGETRSPRTVFQPTRPPRVSESRPDAVAAPTRPSAPSRIERQTRNGGNSVGQPRPVTRPPRTEEPARVQRSEAPRPSTVQRPQRPQAVQQPNLPAVQRPQRPPTVQQPRPSAVQRQERPTRPTAVPRPTRQVDAPSRPSAPSVQRPTRAELRPAAPNRPARQVEQPAPRPSRPARQQAEPARPRPVQQLQRPQKSEMSSRPQRPAPASSAGTGPRQAGGRFANGENP